MGDWVQVLAGSLVFGAAIVGTMVVPTPLSVAPLMAGVIGLMVSFAGATDLAARYGPLQGIAVGFFFIVAGSGIGYRIAAAGLPHLGVSRTRAVALPERTGTGQAVVLVAWTDPERYTPRSVARRHEQLAAGAHIDVPALAVPLVFLAEKARYRVAGGRSPGAAAARHLASHVGEALSHAAGTAVPVSVIPADDPAELGAAVERHVRDGAGTVAVVALGSEDSDAVDRAKEALAAARPGDAGVRIVFGHSVWNDTRLAARLAERTAAAAGEGDVSDVGVVLVSQGEPPEWARSHGTARIEENYFNQRVRMLLVESGLDERTVRIGWLDWQTPDVTEAVRHVAALGRTRIVVVPSAIAMPTLETVVDLHRAVDAARLPDTVTVRILEPWGADEGLVAAVVRSARRALELPERPITP